MDECIFCKIIEKEIPASLEYEDEKVIAFNDIHPQASTHILVIPRAHVEDFLDATDDQVTACKNALHQLIDKKELMGKGYKVQIAGGGAQEVGHVHFHLLSPVK